MISEDPLFRGSERISSISESISLEKGYRALRNFHNFDRNFEFPFTLRSMIFSSSSLCDFVLLRELRTFSGCWSCGRPNGSWNKIGNAGAKNDRLWIAGAKMVMLAMMLMRNMAVVVGRYLFMCTCN